MALRPKKNVLARKKIKIRIRFEIKDVAPKTITNYGRKIKNEKQNRVQFAIKINEINADERRKGSKNEVTKSKDA